MHTNIPDDSTNCNGTAATTTPTTNNFNATPNVGDTAFLSSLQSTNADFNSALTALIQQHSIQTPGAHPLATTPTQQTAQNNTIFPVTPTTQTFTITQPLQTINTPHPASVSIPTPSTNTDNAWLTVGRHGTTIHQPTPPMNITNTTTTNTATTTPANNYNSTNSDDDEDELPYSQSDLAVPTTTIPANRTPSSELTAFSDIQSSIEQTQHLRTAEGRVWSRRDITRTSVVIKFAINSSANCDQAPNTEAIECILDGIIISCGFKFIVDRVAILSIDNTIKTRIYGNQYFSYAFVSPCSTNPKYTPRLSAPTI
jgi:hypothetical protein